MASRSATHAGSWYPKNKSSLTSQLNSFIDATDSAKHAIKGCRVIISPHAGYSYSGPTAAFGFKALDWTSIKRIFILGPSHHFYLRSCALSQCVTYETPLGSLDIDRETVSELKETGAFDDMAIDVDEDEHSIEMQLPFLRHVMPNGVDIPLVPILVGNLDFEAETRFGKILANYLKDSQNLFVVSSDFCHWGNRFSYTYYHASGTSPTKHVTTSAIQKDCPIWKSIENMDRQGMALIEKGAHLDFAQYLARTKNTICGRHPVGVMLAAFEALGESAKFEFLDYRQSNQVTSTSDGSVSYASGVCCP